jgi:carboxyl-terminal processing protease
VNTFKTPRPSSLLTLALFTGAAFAGGALWGSRTALATSHDDSPYAIIGQLGRVLVAVENGYVEPVDRAKLIQGAIKGMVEELDPHSAYLPAQDFSLFQSETEGKFGGVGIEVDARSGDALTVIAPIEGSPAERAGIKSGDRILGVDGEDAQRAGLDKLVRKMRGNPGTHVKLTVKREGAREPLTFDLVREIIHVPSVASKLLDGGVAYVRIKQFQEQTHDELLRAAGKLRAASKAPLVGVVVDMRSNPGGLVDQAADVADEFLSSGTIYTTRHRGQVVDEVKARGGGSFSDLPSVVLVNEWSASASELVAGALQDSKRGLIIGTNTFGKGSVQTIIELPGGAGLRLTTARYYTPSGHSIQADGVHPDIVIQPGKTNESAAFPPLREADLEGHLAAEGTPQVGTPKSATTVIKAPLVDAGGVTEAAGSEAEVEGSEARSVPRDPSTGSDFVLRVGYQVLRGSLVGHGPIVHKP